MENRLREVENEVRICGLLKEMDLEIVELEATAKRRAQKSIRGELVIAPVVDGVELVIPVRVYSNEYKTNGEPNSVFAGLMTAKNTFVSMADTTDMSEVTKVSTGLASIEMTEYGHRGEERIVVFPSIKGVFFNPVSHRTPDEASFHTVIYLANKAFEIKNGEETGRLLLSGVIPDFRGEVSIFPFVVANANAIDLIQSNWEIGDTVRIAGDINFYVDTVKQKIEGMGFGEDIYKDITHRVSEFLVTSGSETGFQGDMALPSELVSIALAEMEERQATKIRKAHEKQKFSTAPSTPVAEKDTSSTGGGLDGIDFSKYV